MERRALALRGDPPHREVGDEHRAEAGEGAAGGDASPWGERQKTSWLLCTVKERAAQRP